MGNWIPGDPTLVAQILKVSSAYSPPPPEGFVSPMSWGVEKHVSERFVAAGVAAGDIAFARDTFVFDFAGSPAQFVDEFRRYYGPTMNAFDAAERPAAPANCRPSWRRSSRNRTEAAGTTARPSTRRSCA